MSCYKSYIQVEIKISIISQSYQKKERQLTLPSLRLWQHRIKEADTDVGPYGCVYLH